MKSAFIKAILLTTFAFHCAPLLADDNTSVSYEPSVVSLTGTIVRVRYDNEAPSLWRGGHAWILCLDRPVSVPAKPSDELDTTEKNVREVHLNIAYDKHPVAKNEFGRVRFTATGTLYHGISAQHLRPIVMRVFDLKRVAAKASHD